MPTKQKIVQVFDKGLIDAIGNKKIPDNAASYSMNFLHLGDRVEISRGRQILGATTSGSGRIMACETGYALDGTAHTYRRRGTVVEYLDNTALTWSSVVTGLTDGEDMFFVRYRTPAGSFMIFSSPTTGLYRINLANPTTVHNFYNASKNFKAYIVQNNNRLWAFGDVTASTLSRVGNDAILRLSYIDDDFPYTSIVGESLGSASGSDTYSGSLAQDFIVGRTLVITHSSETFTDVNGMGILTGSLGGTGTINYTTGAYSITFDSAQGSGAITASYAYEVPDNDGVFDFTYDTPRLAGQGAFFFQATSDDVIQNVFPFDEKFYVMHSKSAWLVDLTETDTSAINKIYRKNIGMPSRRGGFATGEGIAFIDSFDNGEKAIRVLRYNDLSSRVIPVPISEGLNLEDAVFDESASFEHGDFWLWSYKSSSQVNFNDRTLVYNTKWKTFATIDRGYLCFMERNGILYGASSSDLNVYEIFSGFDDNGSVYPAEVIFGSSLLDEEELKKARRFVAEGEMEVSQELIVEASYDDGEFVELGRIDGNSRYVQQTGGSEYGTILYGTGSYGSGESITAHRYMREFRVRSGKFYRVAIRFRTERAGYLSIIKHIWRDIRTSFNRVPTQYR